MSGSSFRPTPADALATIRAYHARTQHHVYAYARALGYLDWATQPDPFRRYAGAARVRLPLRRPDGRVRFAEVCAGSVVPVGVDVVSVAQLFEDSLALSAWKKAGGNRWALRVNPSSGNLHPTEGYLVCGPVAGLSETAAVWHYAPDEHALERRATLSTEAWAAVARDVPADALLVGLSSIAWREAWKYGERAYRYCMHDVGHALGALCYAAAALGWKATLVPLADAKLAALLGLEAASSSPEAEHPDCLVAIHREEPASAAWARRFDLDAGALAALRAAQWEGAPNALSGEHHPWPLIDDAIAATRLDDPAPVACRDRGVRVAMRVASVPDACARALFRQRRSAVAMDGTTGTDAATFFAMLQRATDAHAPPLAILPWQSRVHLLLFVHRVAGLPPGIYCLARGGRDPAWLRARTRKEFLWERAPGVPPDLPLFLLLPIDCKALAQAVSCQQAIAADSAFALGMLAEFAPTLAAFGAWGWRAVHWEAGAIGQLLYLEAEAAGLRATGIGCFFDSAVHEASGISSDDLRTIYHFTTGGAVDDERLQTEPAYPGR